MGNLYIDFETRSDINIKKAGLYRYMETPFFSPLCMAYALDDEPVKLWTPDQPFPVETVTSNTLVAFNVEFELHVLNHKWFRYNEIEMKFGPDDFIDVQALGRLFGFPASLDKLAKVLQVHHLKDSKGTRLINQLCVIKPGKSVPTPHTHPQEFKDFYNYCKQDVRSTRACHEAIIKKDLSPFEQKVFSHMVIQNQRGLPVDIESVYIIKDRLDQFVDKCNEELSVLTNGKVTKGTQVKRIAQYVGLPSIGKEVIETWLAHRTFPEHKKQVLRLRQLVSHSSTAKFERIKEMVCDDNRVRGNLKYYTGHTGRFGGVGFQLHNLPRAKHDDPDKVIDDFTVYPLHGLAETYGNLGAAASKLVRPMIKAPRGMELYVADYVSVENVLLHWAANDIQTTEDFRSHLDQYKVYASRRFNVPYDAVSKKQRTYSKPCVLGLGYGGGAGALQRVASGYGIELSDAAAENDKKFYRATYPEIPNLWYLVQNSLIKATKDKTILRINTGTTVVQFVGRDQYSFILLPSGRFLAYPLPTIQHDAMYDKECFTYMGIDGMSKKWRRLGDQYRTNDLGMKIPDMPIHGGRLVENIIQAMARDLLVYGMLKAEEAGFMMIGSVHDEGIAEQPVGENRLDEYCNVICTLPSWAKDVPLRAEGYTGKRYRKD